MKRRLFGAALALVLAMGLSSVVRSADTGKMEKGDLKMVACDPACGFSCTSRSEQEIIAVVKAHAKTYHNMDMTDEQVKSMIKPAAMPATAKDDKKGT